MTQPYEAEKIDELIGKQVWVKVKDDDDLWVYGTGVLSAFACAWRCALPAS